MSNPEQPDPSTIDDAEKDEYPPDTEFGRSAALDQEKVEQLESSGADESTMSGEPQREPRAGGKAEPDGESTADDSVDEASEESFPASDPPSSGSSSI